MVIVMFGLSCMVIILTILTLNDVSHKNLYNFLSSCIISYVIAENYFRIYLKVTWLIKS
jgi:hypothetical protein